MKLVYLTFLGVLKIIINNFTKKLRGWRMTALAIDTFIYLPHFDKQAKPNFELSLFTLLKRKIKLENRNKISSFQNPIFSLSFRWANPADAMENNPT